MAMSKGKIIAFAAGGTFVLAIAAIGCFLFYTYTTCSEKESELESEVSRYRNLVGDEISCRKKIEPVFPSQKSVNSVNSNIVDCTKWLEDATAFAAQGDRQKPQEETPVSFKQRLADEVRRLVSLPGGVEGRLAAQNFYFGFEKYLGESAVLPEPADVPRLSVQLAAISRFADIFAKAGVTEVKAIRRAEKTADKDQEDAGKPSKAKGKARKNVSDEKKPEVSSMDYNVSILVHPSAFVETLNALTADTRFTVVKNFAFRSTGDMIVDRINAAEALLAKKNEPESTGRRRRRRGFAAEEPAAEQAPKGDDRLVVDPELDMPVQVDMTLSVYDFGRAVAPAAEAATDEGGAKPVAKKEEK